MNFFQVIQIKNKNCLKHNKWLKYVYKRNCKKNQIKLVKNMNNNKLKKNKLIKNQKRKTDKKDRTNKINMKKHKNHYLILLN